MSVCISNTFNTFVFLKSSKLIQLMRLSRKIRRWIFITFGDRLLRTKVLTMELSSFANREDFGIYPLDKYFVFNSASNDEICNTLDLWRQEQFKAWICTASKVTECGLNMQSFNLLEISRIPSLNFNLHFENGREVHIDSDWPKHLTINRVRKLVFYESPISEVLIVDKKSVKKIALIMGTKFDLSIISSFSQVKELKVVNCQVSSTNLSFTKLEVLKMTRTRVLLETTNLRKLKIQGIDLEIEINDFISLQKRLIVLEIQDVGVFTAASIPCSVKNLTFFHNNNQLGNIEDPNLLALQESISKMKLKRLKTNERIRNLENMNTCALEQWDFNGTKKFKEKKLNNYFI